MTATNMCSNFGDFRCRPPLFSVCCISLAQILTICINFAFHICYSIQASTRCPRKRVAVNMQGTVFTLARLKIVPSYQQEILSRRMPEYIEALSKFSHKITTATIP